MDRDVSVNALPTTDPGGDEFPGVLAGKQAAGDYGPCLFFGSAGQRCSGRAAASGFCRRHQPAARSFGEASESSPAKPVLSGRRVGVIFTILALLWPLLADIIRELLRWFR